VNADRFFVKCLDELESRATWEASEYSLLRAAAILRGLIAGGLPLVSEVNRGPNLQLTFRVRHSPIPKPQDAAWWLGGLDPEQSADGGVVEDLTLPQLLAEPIIFLGPDRITVYDMITLAANVRGGVHYGRPRKRKHQLVEDLRIKLAIGDTPIELTAMIPISHVVLAGLGPLRDLVLADLPPVLPPEPDGGRHVTARYVPEVVPDKPSDAPPPSMTVRYTAPTSAPGARPRPGSRRTD
jgi:hypothetical protein